MPRSKFMVSVIVLVLALAVATAALLARVGFLILRERGTSAPLPVLAAPVLDAECGRKVAGIRGMGSCEDALAEFRRHRDACGGSRVEGPGFEGTYEQQVLTLVDCLDGEGRRERAGELLRESRSWPPWRLASSEGLCPGNEFAEAQLESRLAGATSCRDRAAVTALLMKERALTEAALRAAVGESAVAFGGLDGGDTCFLSLKTIVARTGRLRFARVVERGEALVALGDGDFPTLRLTFAGTPDCMALSEVRAAL